MATRTISVAGGNWSSVTAWAEGAVPTAADDVVATNLSGSLTIDGTSGSPSLCRSADFTSYVGTLTHASSKQLNIGDASGGKLVLVAGMTYVPSTGSILNMVSTTTGNAVTCAGKSLGPITFNGSGGAWSLTDAFSSQRDITVTIGSVTAASTAACRSLIVNGGTFTAGGTITPTSTCTVAGGTFACGSNTVNGTGLTVTSGTATVNNWNGTGALSVSGTGVCNLTTGTFTSAAVSAGTVTMSGTFTTSTGGLNISGTGNFDATGLNLVLFTSFIMSSSGLFKCANLTCGSTMSFTGGTTTVTGNVSGTTLSMSGSTARTINMGNGTWTLSGRGVVVSYGLTPTNLTLNPQGSLIDCTDVSATTKNPTFGGVTLNNLRVRGGASAGLFIFNPNATFNNLQIDANANVQLTAGITVTCASLTATGTAGNLAAIATTSGGTPATMSVASGTIANDYMSLKDIATAGGACFYAGANSTNTSGNSGWIFATKPPSGQQYL